MEYCQESARRQDTGPEELLQMKQVLIPGNKIAGFSDFGAFKKSVIVRILMDRMYPHLRINGNPFEIDRVKKTGGYR